MVNGPASRRANRLASPITRHERRFERHDAPCYPTLTSCTPGLEPPGQPVHQSLERLATLSHIRPVVQQLQAGCVTSSTRDDQLTGPRPHSSSSSLGFPSPGLLQVSPDFVPDNHLSSSQLILKPNQPILSIFSTTALSPIMSADTASSPNDLRKVDSAIDDKPGSPTSEKKPSHRRTSSTVSGVFKMEDLGECDVQPPRRS